MDMNNQSKGTQQPTLFTRAQWPRFLTSQLTRSQPPYGNVVAKYRAT